MSLFLRNQHLLGLEVDPERLQVAEVQFDAMAATFDRMMAACAGKCIPEEYGESELLKGEMCCVDRCVTKYMTANRAIGEYAQRARFLPENDMPGYRKAKDMMGKPK